MECMAAIMLSRPLGILSSEVDAEVLSILKSTFRHYVKV